MNILIKRIEDPNAAFISLVDELDRYLAVIDGNEHGFYDQFNSIKHLKHIVLAYHQAQAVGCGAFKPLNEHTIEIKRMYVRPEMRGRGIAKAMLEALECWGSELGYKNGRLETGKRQKEAVIFYKKSGYELIPNYDQYIGIENSVCFEKTLT